MLCEKVSKKGRCERASSDLTFSVDFNPFYHNYFAAAFDDGTVQAWDLRKPNACERRITAHDGKRTKEIEEKVVICSFLKGLVLSVAWHPQDSSILASGGRDGTVKVWDLNVANRPRYQIQTIAAVGKVCWRPKCTYQICSSAAVIDFSMQIWDLHRPTVPLATISGHGDVVTGMVWPNESPHSVITASKDGTIAQVTRESFFVWFDFINRLLLFSFASETPHFLLRRLAVLQCAGTRLCRVAASSLLSPSVSIGPIPRFD